MSELISSLKESTRLIARRGSRVKMIVAGILMVFAFVMPMLIGLYTTIAIFGTTGTDPMLEYAVAYGIVVLLGLFVTLPSAVAFLTFARQTYSESKYGYADIKSRGAYNYFRLLFASLRMCFWPVIGLMVIQVAFVLAATVKETLGMQKIPMPFMLVFLPVALCGVVLVGLIMWVRSKRFLTPYYFSGGRSVRKANKLSREGTVRHPFYSDLYFFVLIALSVLSLLTFGVLFILWVQPHMMFTYFEFAERMTAKIDGGNKNE